MEPTVQPEVEATAEAQAEQPKKRRAKRVNSEENAPPDPITGAPREPEQPQQQQQQAQRLSIPLTADGLFDFQSMRAGTREKLQQAIKSSGIEFTAVPESPAFGAAVSDHLWQFLGGVGVALALRAGHDKRDVMRYVPMNRAELDALRDPTGRVIDKYAGKLGKYQEESQLALTLLAVVQYKYMALENAREERVKGEQLPADRKS